MTNEIPQCIHIPDGSVVVSGELFDMACAAIAERDKLLSEIEQLKVERDFARRELTRACQETREALSRDITAARGSPEPSEHRCEDRITLNDVVWRCTKPANHRDHERQPEGASRDASSVPVELYSSCTGEPRGCPYIYCHSQLKCARQPTTKSGGSQ